MHRNRDSFSSNPGSRSVQLQIGTMWAAGAVAAEAAAAGASLARSDLLQSTRARHRLILSPLRARSALCRLQLLLTLSLVLQQLMSVVSPLLSALLCLATKPEHQESDADSWGRAFSPPEKGGRQFPSGTAGALARLKPLPAVSEGGSMESVSRHTHGKKQSSPTSYGDEEDWRGSQGPNGDDSSNKEEQWSPQSGQTVTRAAEDFVYAMNSFLESAKQHAAAQGTSGRNRDVAADRLTSAMGWSLHDAGSQARDAGDTPTVPENEGVTERPAWLRPEHRPSLLTRMYMKPRESGVCPAVGGFGHPLGREYEELQNWDELLCRSRGVLRNTNAADPAYDAFVLVKGYRGGDGPSEDSSLAARDGSSNSGASMNVDISGMRDDGGEPSFGALEENRSERGADETHWRESQQREESSTRKPRKRHRKTAAELEDELSEVVDLLSMLHCHLANVVDLRHPSNFQLYASIRQVALLRSRVLRQKKAEVGDSDQRTPLPEPELKPRVRRRSSTTFHFPLDSRSGGGNGEGEGGVLRGTSVPGVAALAGAYSPRGQENHDSPGLGLPPRASAPPLSARAMWGSYGQYSPRRQEQKHDALPPFDGAAGTAEHEQHPRTSNSALAVDESERHVLKEANAPGSATMDELEDESGPVLVVVRNVSAPERLFFGAREIKEFLFGRLLRTAYEIQAYNEFKRKFFDLARNADFGQLSPRSSAVDGHPGRANRPTSLQGRSATQAGTTSPFETAAVAVTGQPEDAEARAKEMASTEPSDVKHATGEIWWHSPAAQRTSSELFAAEKGDKPWWSPLGLRFDLYVSLAGVTPDRALVSPTASLLRLVSEPRMRPLVCVYNYDDPRTNIPPVLQTNGFTGLPALVLGRRVTTGARNIERLLLSIVEYKPAVPYSAERYVPVFLFREPHFSELLAAATAESTSPM